MADLLDRIPHDANALKKLLDRIPGYKGYREREERRTADRLLRDHLVGLVDGIRQKLIGFQRELQSRGEFKPVTDLDRIGRRLTRARDRLDHAPYGYAGFLDAAQVNEAELGRMYDYDLSLKETLAQIEAAADAVTGGTQQNFDQMLRQLGDEIEEFSSMLDQRSEVAAELAP
ncbi:hypothetical protein LLH23_02540 [bacterium]|nr:hypothetical protein [bacterium]